MPLLTVELHRPERPLKGVTRISVFRRSWWLVLMVRRTEAATPSQWTMCCSIEPSGLLPKGRPTAWSWWKPTNLFPRPTATVGPMD